MPCSHAVLVALLSLGSTALASPGNPGDETLFARPGNAVRDLARSEDTQSLVAGRLRATLLRGLREREWERIHAVLAPGFRGRFPRPGEGRAVDDDGLTMERHGRGATAILDADGFVAALDAQVGSWTDVERASWSAFEFLLAQDGRTAFTAAHLRLGGLDGAGRSSWEGSVEAELVLIGGEWALRGFDVVEAWRLEHPRPAFRDVTDQVGLHFNESEANRALRQQIVDSRTNVSFFGLSVVDWNGDDFWDVVATEALNQSVLFLNDGRGGFVPADDWPVRDPAACPSQFLVVDLDGDGRHEVVGSGVHGYRGDEAWIGLHTRRGDDWVLLPRALTFANPSGHLKTDMQGITAADVDRDGHLDLFVCAYEGNMSRSERWNLLAAYDGDDNLLFMNAGGLRFREESDARGIRGTQYTFCAQFFDFDGDGDADLLEINDYGPNVLWDNRGDGTFEPLEGHLLARDSNYSMGVAVADWEGTGEWSVHVSNMYSHAGNRIVRLVDSLDAALHEQVALMAAGNQLFTRDADGTQWRDTGASAGIQEAEWAWGCAFLDVDNDGDQELFVANGNTSFADPAAPDY